MSSRVRSQGVGAAMIRRAMERGRSRNCVMAQLSTDRTRVGALRFCARLGLMPSHHGMKLHLKRGYSVCAAPASRLGLVGNVRGQSFARHGKVRFIDENTQAGTRGRLVFAGRPVGAARGGCDSHTAGLVRGRLQTTCWRLLRLASHRHSCNAFWRIVAFLGSETKWL